MRAVAVPRRVGETDGSCDGGRWQEVHQRCVWREDRVEEAKHGDSANGENPWALHVADSKVCHGQPTFRGTRVFVADVLDQIARGLDWETIIEEWHGSITHEAIAEAVHLAAQALRKHSDDFAVQFSAGYGGYTTERDVLFSDLTLDKVLEAIKSKSDSERV